MNALILVILCATIWGLWNLFEKIKRLDALIEQWEETLATLHGDHEVSAVGAPVSREGASLLRVIIEITDAVGLAKSYHWAGGAGALAPAVMKKALHGRVLEETQKKMQEGGIDADLKVIVL